GDPNGLIGYQKGIQSCTGVLRKPMGIAVLAPAVAAVAGAYAFTASNTISNGGAAGVGTATISGYTVSKLHRIVLHRIVAAPPAGFVFKGTTIPGATRSGCRAPRLSAGCGCSWRGWA